MATVQQSQPGPSAKQLRFLRALAHQTGTTCTPPTTRRQASRQIAAMVKRPVSDQLEFAFDDLAVRGGLMRPVDPKDPASYPGALACEHTDIPPGLTLAEWRIERAGRARRERGDRRGTRCGEMLDAVRSIVGAARRGAAPRRTRRWPHERHGGDEEARRIARR